MRSSSLLPSLVLIAAVAAGCATPPSPPRGTAAVAAPVDGARAPFFIGPGITRVLLEMPPPGGPPSSEVTLLIENVTGETRAPPFKVYLNLPDGSPDAHPELLAGSFGMYGLVESSDRAAGGAGLTFTVEVTALLARLGHVKGWNPRTLELSFVPASWDAPVPRVRVGRVRLHRG